MNQETEFIYLFSSNARQLYMVDALNSLALPKGWIQHFRYQAKYVDSRIGDCINDQNKLDSFLGSKVIIVSVDQDNSSKPNVIRGVYPIRYGNLVKLRNISGVIHFWFSLDKLFVYPENNQITSADLVSAGLRKLLSNNGPDNSIYASIGSNLPLSSTHGVNASEQFLGVVRALTGRGFEGEKTLFVAVSDFILTKRELSHGKVLTHTNSDVPVVLGPTEGLSGYELVDNSIYSINLSSLNEVLPGQVSQKTAYLFIEVNKDYVEVIGPSELPVTGRYDQYQFIIKPKRQTRNQWTILSISVKKDSEILGLRWDVPVLVKPDLARIGINSVADFVVPVGIAVNVFNQLPLLEDWQDKTLTLNIFSFILVIVGTFLLGLRQWADRR
jgi:hypothetical protein